MLNFVTFDKAGACTILTKLQIIVVYFPYPYLNDQNVVVNNQHHV